MWRSAQARARAPQAAWEQSRELGDEAVRLAATTEWPNVLADTLLDRARVAVLAGGDAVSEEDIARATVIYLAKSNVAGQARATALATGRRPEGHFTTGQGGPR